MPQHQQRQRRKCNPNRKAGQSIFFLLLIYWQGPNHTSRSASAPARLQTEDRANELKYKYIPSKGWFKLALTYSVEAFRADPVEDAITWRKNTRPSEASTAKKGKPSKFPAPGDIWMHTNTQDNTVQVWQYSKEKKWEGCTGSFINDDGATSHPKWHTHVLCIGQVPGYIGLPVYIQRKSYEKRSKRNETDKGSRDLAPGSGALIMTWEALTREALMREALTQEALTREALTREALVREALTWEALMQGALTRRTWSLSLLESDLDPIAIMKNKWTRHRPSRCWGLHSHILIH